MKTKHTTAIRPPDLELLRNLASIEARDMTEILHRALITYTTTVENTGVDGPSVALPELERTPAQHTAPGTTTNIAHVAGPTPKTIPHESLRTPGYPKRERKNRK